MMLRAILEALLQGQFLCSISHTKLFQALQNEETLTKVNGTLNSLGKELRSTDNKETYYCAYIDVAHPKDARQIQTQFEQLRNQIAPVVHFLTLIMRVEQHDSILMAGDTLRFHDLLSHIEIEPAYLTDLKYIGRYELFKKIRNKNNNQERLKAILETMEKEGYLFLTNAPSMIYQATGKIEYFYRCIEFISDYEQIPLQDETDEQKDLRFDH